MMVADLKENCKNSKRLISLPYPVGFKIDLSCAFILNDHLGFLFVQSNHNKVSIFRLKYVEKENVLDWLTPKKF